MSGDEVSPYGLPYGYCFESSLSKNNLDVLKNAFDYFNRDFTIIFTPKEMTVYKICHYFYQKYELSPTLIKFIEGVEFETRLQLNYKAYYNREWIEKQFEEGIFKDVNGKVVVISNLKAKWNVPFAYLLINMLKLNGVIGLIFSSQGDDNIGKLLIEQTALKIFQFPVDEHGNGMYTSAREKLEDDGL